MTKKSKKEFEVVVLQYGCLNMIFTILAEDKSEAESIVMQLNALESESEFRLGI